MAGELTLTASAISLVRKEEAFEAVAGEALTAGQLVFVDGTTGKVLKTAATSAGALGYRRGIVLRSVAAGKAVTVLNKGLVSLGNALSAVAYGAPIYASDTAGAIATSVGTVTYMIGQVEAVWSTPTVPDKLLRIDM